MIRINNISFAYKKQSNLFEGLSLELAPGHIYGLLGKNGAGKTSLLKLITGVVFPKEGQCTCFGEDSTERNPSMLSDLMVIPEEYELPSIKASKYVKLHAPFYPRFEQEKFERIANEFELDVNKDLNEMSFGQKKKFILSFGLATNASLMLLDEPTNGLDIPSKSQFRRIIASSFSAEQLVIISTHQVRDLETLIDGIVILDRGKILFNQKQEDISSRLIIDYSKEEVDPKSCLYTEGGIGGTKMLKRANGKTDTNMDLEFLFSAIVNKPDAINNVFNS